jgi:hypothetical protein
MDEALFHLYYAYTKTGNKEKAAEIKKLLASQFSNSRFASIAVTGKDPLSNAPSPEVTKVYEGIYDQYIEGNFEEANRAKQQADSIYHTNYWSPHLLYIQAVYHIKQREDSVAKSDLKTLIQQNGGTPLADKATNLLQVLNRRAQIETELTNLQLNMPEEERPPATGIVSAPVITAKDTAVAKVVPKTDTAVTKPIAAIKVTPPTPKKDTVATKAEIAKKPEPKQVVDTIAKKPVVTKPASPYTFNANAEYYAVIILNRVDNVFAGEAKNAFFRYNREKFSSQPLEVSLTPFDDANKLVLIGNFASAQAAVDYVQRTKPLSPKEIVPWLKADKYTFTIVSKNNLQALLEQKNLAQYTKFLEQNLPIKF